MEKTDIEQADLSRVSLFQIWSHWGSGELDRAAHTCWEQSGSGDVTSPALRGRLIIKGNHPHWVRDGGCFSILLLLKGGFGLRVVYQSFLSSLEPKVTAEVSQVDNEGSSDKGRARVCVEGFRRCVRGDHQRDCSMAKAKVLIVDACRREREG